MDILDIVINEIERLSIDKNIIKQVAIPDFIDIDILKEHVKKDVENNKEFFDDVKLPYRISDSGKAEWIVKKSINNSKLIANGNNPFDVSVDNEIFIDVAILTLNGSCTNEKSIIQNFKTTFDLDQLFKECKGDIILDIFKEKLSNKYSNNTYKNLYYILFICCRNKIYLSCFKITRDNIKNMTVNRFSDQNISIFVNNFIDEKYGNVKIYRSKKRLELKLNKNILDQSILIY